MNRETPKRSLAQPAPNVVPHTTPEFLYRIVDESGFDAVGPLWEKLRAYHAQLPWRFAAEMHGSPFEPRKQELLAKAVSGKLRIELVSTGSEMADVAYCVSTVSADGRGEVDSLFVEEGFRGCGIGSELVRCALAWLESAGATSKLVTVAHGNAEALALYERFGFYPRSVVLQQDGNAT
jgi:ribosomal protein S18 acetylase RimI-like enzyme